ncbi:MAG: hypothetical protein J0H08_04360 [Rhizobiales bacterium]|nr:hypothetical protein [Hyphomicrobiales bacterium]
MSRLTVALVAALAAQPLVAGSASATAGLVCDALDGSGASVEMNLPRSAGAPPNWVRVITPAKSFSSLSIDEGATPIQTRQSFEEGDTFNIDLTDADFSDAIIRIRLLRAEEGDEMPVYIGYVHVVGERIYPITCTEDE